VEDQATVRLVTVQVQRDAEEHDLDRGKGHRDVAPPGQFDETVGKESAHPVISSAISGLQNARAQQARRRLRQFPGADVNFCTH
jgi:hypothetical protein